VSEPPKTITQLLTMWRQGDESALERLIPLVQQELHQLARAYMGHERPNHTLQPSALVNEAYIRLLQPQKGAWQDRTHFFAVASSVMRHVLVDYARGRRSLKRGVGVAHVEITEQLLLTHDRIEEVLAIDEALTHLSSQDPRKARVVELRYFAGLGVNETAEVLGVAPDTVTRDWNFARAWLKRHLSKESA
jgi:RNA polymerase sigma-70 factor (ECF subfamily)